MKSDQLTPLEKAALLISNLKAKVSLLESREGIHDVAVVGIGCKLPKGLSSPEKLWEGLLSSIDTVEPLPKGRFGTLAEEDYMGSFVQDIDQFDASFFGISNREATAMDPQQRLLLQTSWHALEDAGMIPSALKGTKTGVFIGAMNYDYSEWSYTPEDIDIYTGTGTSNSILSGRLAHFYDFKGPALTIDTACSSSLVAIHQAVKSLQTNESELCMVGGVNAILSPTLFRIESVNNMLAKDGRCKTFDENADGFVRAEGCGVVILKPLERAISDGDRIYCVIKGSAVNHDGRSSGIMAPNQSSQEALLKTALEDSKLNADDISFVECHGTGTRLGDPIEATAIQNVYRSQSGKPLFIGSLKTNMGHLEGAAGIGGFIKLALSLYHQTIAPSIHFSQANSLINWEHVSVATKPIKLDHTKQSGAVNSFGFSGTNANVIASTYQHPITTQRITNSLPILVSAKSEGALSEMVRHIGEVKLSPQQKNTLALKRSHFSYCKLFFNEKTIDSHPGTIKEVLWNKIQPPVYFLFSGQGAQFEGMGRVLYEKNSVYRKYLNYCDKIYHALTGDSLLSLIHDSDLDYLSHTRNTQVAIFSVSYSIAKCWEKHGVKPKALIGHSLGEWAAACFSGMLELQDAIALIIKRGELMEGAPSGKMIAVKSSLTSLEEYEQFYKLDIAAINGNKQIVVSGSSSDIDSYKIFLRNNNILYKEVNAYHAFHSRLMDHVAQEFQSEVDKITFSEGNYPIVSNLNGENISIEAIRNGYWSKQIRNTVQFVDSLQAVEESAILIETGPGTTLISLAAKEIKNVSHSIPGFATINHPNCFFDSFSYLFERGYSMDLSPFFEEVDPRTVSAPLYAFDKERFWIRDKVEYSLNRLESQTNQAKVLFRKWQQIKDSEIEDSDVQNSKTWKVNSRIWHSDMDEHYLEFIHFLNHQRATLKNLFLDLSEVAEAWKDNYTFAFIGCLQSYFLEKKGVIFNLVFLYDDSCNYQPANNGQFGIYKCKNGEIVELKYFERPSNIVARMPTISQDKTYIITGASGSLGLHFIEYLFEQNVQELYLLGRRPLDKLSSQHKRWVNKFKEDGRKIEYHSADAVSDNIFETISRPAGGFFHLAGTYTNSASESLELSEVRNVFDPKINLTKLIYDRALALNADFLMIASSAVTLTGAPMLTHYAFANGWMDGFTERKVDMDIISFAWGGWKGSNMMRESSNEVFQNEWGFKAIEPNEMLSAFQNGIPGYQAVLSIDFDRFFALAPQMKGFKPFLDFVSTQKESERPVIHNLDVHTIEDFLRDALAEILKDEPENLDFRKPFEEIGFNSLLAIELSNKINSVFGLSLPSTIIYAHPSPGVLLEFLIDEIIPKEETADEDELLELQRLLDEKLKSGKG